MRFVMRPVKQKDGSVEDKIFNPARIISANKMKDSLYEGHQMFWLSYDESVGDKIKRFNYKVVGTLDDFLCDLNGEPYFDDVDANAKQAGTFHKIQP